MIDIYSTFLEYKINKKNGKKYFIGESIIPFNKYKVDKSDFIADNHWNDRSKAHEKANLINSLRTNLMPEISKELNNIHNINFSSSSWNLILGNWFNQFTGVIIDRYLSIENIFKNENNFNFYTYKNTKIKDLIPNDTKDAQFKFTENDIWNNLFFIFLIKEIIKIKNINNIKIISYNLQESTKKIVHKKQLLSSYILLFKNILKFIFKLFLKTNFRKTKKVFVFLNPSISLLKILKLKIRLRSSIYLEPKFPDLGSYFYEEKLRSWKINEDKHDPIEVKLIKRLIPLFIPKSFIEGFPIIMNDLSKNHMKIKSNIVFTSSCHYTGFDIKKIWMALQKENGSKLIIGQHGGSLQKFNINTDFEREIADKVLVHGKELFNCKKAENVGQYWNRIKRNKYNKKGNALLINFAIPRYSMEPRCMPLSSQMCKYFEEQFNFYEELLPQIKNQFKVRIYTKGDYEWQQEERWINRFPKVNIDRGEISLAKAILNSRLIISTYNGSTYQETLSANIPTIIYWDMHLSEIPFLAKDDFKNLENVGIFHRNPLSAAKFLNKIWGNLDNWWNSKSVQIYRKEFCYKYCDRETNIIENLSRSLNV